MAGDVQGMLVSDQASCWDQVLGPELTGEGDWDFLEMGCALEMRAPCLADFFATAL